MISAATDRSYNKFHPFCCYITNEMIGTQLNVHQSIWVVYTDPLLRQRSTGELCPRLLNSSANLKLTLTLALSMTHTRIIVLNGVFKSIQPWSGTLILTSNVVLQSGTIICVIDLFVCHLGFRAAVLPQLLDYRVQRVVLLLTHTLCKVCSYWGVCQECRRYMLTLDNPFSDLS